MAANGQEHPEDHMKSWQIARLVCGAIFIATAAVAADGPVKIGVLNDQNSVYSVDGGKETVEAVRMAVEDTGPVLGQRVEVLAADHQNKPDVGLSIARQWFDVDGVDAIADVPNSAIGFGVQNLSTEKKKVALLIGSMSADITGSKCSPYAVQWGADTWSMSRTLADAVMARGGRDWFFIGADYTFGKSLVRETGEEVTAKGGKVLGAVYAPLGANDFSSFVLQAQQSRADVIALANSSADTVNTLKQAIEFGIDRKRQRFAAYILFISHIKAMTLDVAQGLLLVNPFYWDLDEDTRAFSRRFMERVGHPPDWDPVMNYSAVLHYLKAIQAVGSKEADKVIAKMREMPVNDVATKNGHLRPDGRLERDLYLLEVKAPAESTGPWDLYKVDATIPAAKAFRPLDQGGCPLIGAH
jgi:branched-chain amino acid transport system substrate-binding protein